MRQRVALAFLFVLVLLAAHAVWDYVETRRFFAVIDEMRRRGEPVSRDALGRWERPTDDEEIRAARYYNAAGELAFRDWVLPPERLPGTDARRKASADVDAISKTGALPDDVATRLGLLAEEYSEALDMVDRAAPLRFSRFAPHGFEDYPRTYSLEALDTACSARTLRLAFETSDDRAGQSLWSCLRLRRAHVRPSVTPIRPLLVQLRLIVERTRPSSSVLAQLQETFGDRERPNAIEQDIKERTALLIESALAELYGTPADPLVPAANSLWTWRPVVSPSRPWLLHQLTSSLREQQRILVMASQPWPAKLRDLETLSDATPPLPQRLTPNRTVGLVWYSRYLPRMLAPSTAATVLALTRTAQGILAVERYRRDNGRPPSSLGEVVPSYIKVWPQDPFSGAPLLYRVEGSGFSVYSVGSNGKDDGGEFEPLTGVAGQNTKDVGLTIRHQEK